MADNEARSAVSETPLESTVVIEPRMRRLERGMVLRERWVLDALLGEGGMGQVWRAVDQLDPRSRGAEAYVAIKVLSDKFRHHPRALEVLRHEAMHKLNHPNIVGVQHFDQDKGHDCDFIVMEYLRGASLERRIRDEPNGLPYEQAWPIIRGCGEALKYMHEHRPCIVHSDFKPGNVFVTDRNEIKVLDLGIARTIEETLIAQGTTRLVGGAAWALTEDYASCEMFEGSPPDPRDDIYALGCVAYELLTGVHPFGRERSVLARKNGRKPTRPKALRTRSWRALERALAFNRADRTGTVAEFLEAFGPATTRGNARPWIAASAALLAMVAGGAYWIYQQRPSAADVFRAELLSSATDQSASPNDVALNLEQGALLLELAKQNLRDGDLDRALYFLSGDVSSAERAYREVLRHAAAEEDRRRAADGLLSVSNAYLEGVEELRLKEKFVDGLRFVCQGKRFNPYEPAFDVKFDELRELAGSGGKIESCDRLPATMPVAEGGSES
jgi:serine/threonine protein kinase